jgi:hypothetical protein
VGRKPWQYSFVISSENPRLSVHDSYYDVRNCRMVRTNFFANDRNRSISIHDDRNSNFEFASCSQKLQYRPRFQNGSTSPSPFD